MKSFVLSGGSIKGSWQAGAIEKVLASGFEPDIVTGISTGALNAAALAAWQPQADDESWEQTGIRLANFWTKNITSQDKVARMRNWIELGFRLLFNKWKGVIDTDRLNALVRETLGKPPAGPLICRVGAVSLKHGALSYVGPESPYFVDSVMASTAEPVSMPPRDIAGELYMDGGIRDIAPLRESIRLGADDIIVIACQPEGAGKWHGNPGDVLQLIGRSIGIVTDEIIANDIERCESINRLLLTLPPDIVASNPELKGKRVVRVRVIRPLKKVPILLDSFDADDIEHAVQLGREDAERVLDVAA